MAKAKRKSKNRLMMLDGKWYRLTSLSKTELRKMKSEQLWGIVDQTVPFSGDADKKRNLYR